MLVVIVGEETTGTHKNTFLREQRWGWTIFWLRWTSLSWSAFWRFHSWVRHWHASLLYRHAFSPSENANLFHNASPPARCHSASCGHVESLLSDTSADRPSRFTADGGISKSGCQIFSDPLEKYTVLCPVTRLKMDVHWAASSLEWVQSTSNDAEFHLSHAGYVAVRKKSQDFGERGSCVMFWPVKKGLHFRR